VAAVTAVEEPLVCSSDEEIECLSCTAGGALVRVRIVLPRRFPEGRRLGVERYVRAAAIAMADKIGRDE
jgi:hypothetical protein